MVPRITLDIEVEPMANATVETLQRQAMRQLAVLLDADSPEEAARLVSDVEFNVYTDSHIKFAEGDIIGTYPVYRASMRVQLRNEDKGTYSGRLF